MGVGGALANKLLRQGPEGDEAAPAACIWQEAGSREENPLPLPPQNAVAVDSGPPFPLGLGEAGGCSGLFVFADTLIHTLPGPPMVPADGSGLGPTPAAPQPSPAVPCTVSHQPLCSLWLCPRAYLPQSPGLRASLRLLQVPFAGPELFLVPSAPSSTEIGPPPRSGSQLSLLVLLQPPPRSLPQALGRLRSRRRLRGPITAQSTACPSAPSR